MMKFSETVLKSYPTGSRYICNPPPTDTDNDTLFLVNGFHDYEKLLTNEGWEPCGKNYEQVGEFSAWRKGEENYIVTEDEDFFSSYVQATEGAKALNLFNKDDRIKLFQTVMLARSQCYIGFVDKFPKDSPFYAMRKAVGFRFDGHDWVEEVF